MTEFFGNLLFGWVPWWAWAGIALLALGGVYKWVGWQGVLALGFGVAAFFGYRQGWRDRGEGKPPAVPVDVPRPTPKRKTTRRNFGSPATGKSLIERLTGRKE